MIEEKSQYKILKQYVLGHKDWSDTSLLAINLKNVILKELDFSRSCLVDVILESCNLEKASFIQSDLNNCNLSYSWLKETNFSKANLVDINFNDTCLEKANFRQANLANAKFSKAYMYCADLRGAYLKGADFSEAYLAGAMYDQDTVFDNGFDTNSSGMTYLDKNGSQDAKSILIDKGNSESQATRYYRGIKYEYISKLEDMKVTEAESDSVFLKYSESSKNSLSYRGNNYQSRTRDKINVTKQIAKKSSLKYRGQSCVSKEDDVEE